MDYEALLDEADRQGLIVKEKPLKYNNGRIKGNRIAIRQDIDTTAEKACVLAEELGHYYTSYGDILDLSDSANRKQEHRARIYGYQKMIGLHGIISAYEAGCQNRYDMAEHLGVTEEYLQECLEAYQSKYGDGVQVGDYYVTFEPGLVVGRMV